MTRAIHLLQSPVCAMLPPRFKLTGFITRLRYLAGQAKAMCPPFKTKLQYKSIITLRRTPSLSRLARSLLAFLLPGQFQRSRSSLVKSLARAKVPRRPSMWFLSNSAIMVWSPPGTTFAPMAVALELAGRLECRIFRFHWFSLTKKLERKIMARWEWTVSNTR
jgi:hypothetical protein